MNDQAINPIQSLLNELASIAKSEQTPQTLEDLERIKSIAARLYLEIDVVIMELLSPNDEVLDARVAEQEYTQIRAAVPDDVNEIRQSSIEVEGIPSGDSEAEAMANREMEIPLLEDSHEMTGSPASNESENIAISTKQETEIDSISSSIAEDSQTIDSNAVLMSLPLSKRFEFANFLFGGDMGRFRLFIEEFARENGTQSSAVFERWYAENDWRRKDESATDLVRSLKKLFV